MISRVEAMDQEYLAKLPGCYSLVTPFLTSVTSSMWKLATEKNVSTNTDLAANVSFEDQAKFDLFVSVVEVIQTINLGMQQRYFKLYQFIVLFPVTSMKNVAKRSFSPWLDLILASALGELIIDCNVNG